ncbi:MAG: ribosome recycling factor [Candidatus Nomurabacteria bacterium]|nr:MAG: ribosome recycling factor [Candidatus Nomurabacteria bacterium]
MSDTYTEKFQKALDFYKSQLATLRTGRANPALVENLKVEAYGSNMPLQQLANISAPEPRLIVIQPWDASMVQEIEKAIKASPLGLQPSLDGTTIRLPLPELTEERRKELLKVVVQFEEEAKVAMKKTREEVLRTWRDQGKEGSLSEDIVERQEKELQESLQKFHTQLRDLAKAKEEEIMTV